MAKRILGKNKVKEVLDILDLTYPDAKCALDYENLYQLIVAVALSAQTTDKSVNKVTPKLFERFKTPEELGNAKVDEVIPYIKQIGMYKTKAKNIIGLGKKITEDFSGEVPDNYEDLITLPGVGRKTANVVLSVGYGIPRIAVDTHVFRVSNRIGIVHEENVLKTELALMERIPKKRWSAAHHDLIFHGRNICHARKPKCEICPIINLCQQNI